MKFLPWILLLFSINVSAQTICGDGIRQENEACDGNDFDSINCQMLGFDGGSLRCSQDCNFQTESCYRCGDGEQNRNELCDTNDLNNASCLTEGFLSGELSCSQNCLFDFQNCRSCGDNIIDENEDCDSDDLNEVTCADFGFDGGSLQCSQDCFFDTNACSDNLCGNDFADPGEDCDNEDLKNENCHTLGYDGGLLSCSRACTFNVEECEGNIDRLCGDDLIAPDEQCDGSNLNNATCQTHGFQRGAISCLEDCSFDFSLCERDEDAGPQDVGSDVQTSYEDAFENAETSEQAFTPVTVGCCGIKGGEPIEADSASFWGGIALIALLFRRKNHV